MDRTGTLYLVGTPIGNLEDITLRALRVLREVDLIAAEDTRNAQKLLRRYGISRKLLSYYDSREKRKSGRIICRLKEGRDVALVSDAGMPGISDPGYRLVDKAVRAGIRVVPVPGPSAMIAALVASGLPSDRFVFEGFLPATQSSLRKKLFGIQSEERTIIFYESPRRLARALSEVEKIMGERRVAVARELTKKFEELVCGPVSEVKAHFKQSKIRGEVVLLLEGRKRKSGPFVLPVREQIAKLVREFGISRMEAIKLVADLSGVGKSEIYRAYHKKEEGD